MANQEHLDILKQGVEVWNQWRKEHRDVHPDLSGVDFDGAHLNDARFSFSQFNGARFSDAQLHRAYFVNPASFLQGASVPDSMLAYARSPRQNPTVYATCLLSYASPDQNFAKQLQTDLQAHGVLCRRVPYDVLRTEEVSEFIHTPMVIHDMLLLVISEHSATEVSRWALNGIVKEALLKERKGFTPVLLPIHLDQAPHEMRGSWTRLLRLAQHQSRDFTHWNDQNVYQADLKRLLYDLEAEPPMSGA